MRKYKVLKKYPKPIMNSSRMVTLEPGAVVYLKYERQLERLIKLGFIKEVLEIKKREPKPALTKQEEPKKLIQPKKPKAKYQTEALEDKTGE